VIAALEEYLEALRSGRPWSREEFLAGHSEIAEALGECLSGLEFIQTASVELEGSNGHRSVSRTEPVPLRARLGDYRVIREVGRGGMGVVYEAEQTSLGRRVALKVLPFAAAIDPKQRQRFQIEAQAAAQLHHPHIVPIFAVGCDHGIHYYAMQFVEGRSLAAIIRELRANDQVSNAAGPLSAANAAAPFSTEDACGCVDEPAGTDPSPGMPRELPATDPARSAPPGNVSPLGVGLGEDGGGLTATSIGPAHHSRAYCRNVARLGAEAAEALDHAHGLGVLHRDIKPANLLIDGQGAVWITDFGLARFHSERSITGTGDVVGTLRYMSPEQAQARRGVVDQRTDIYSLGVTLYELLTLRPAFDGSDHQELLHQIALQEPPSPRRLNPAVPRDLETIILKAMAKDLSSRYATAQELAADLRRFLDDRPILASRPGPLERSLRWARRHWELVSTAVAIVVVSLAISTTLVWAQARKTKVQAGIARQAALTAEAALRDHHNYIIETYPLLDRFFKDEIERAAGLRSSADPITRKEVERLYDRALTFFQRTSVLPSSDLDLELRLIVARACSRLGSARMNLSELKALERGEQAALPPEVVADYSRSVDLLENLLRESPSDPRIHRYLADSLGLFGKGCCSRIMNREAEAETCYRRAIQIRSHLVRGTGFEGDADARARADVAGENSDVYLLVTNAQFLANLLERQGRAAEARDLRQRLVEDIKAVAARFAGPNYQERRQMWARQLVGGWSQQLGQGVSLADRAARQSIIRWCRLAIILDPASDLAYNQLAWAMASVPGDPWYDAKEALRLARQAVALNPSHWYFWNTLGVAAYRVGDWPTASEYLEKSIGINGGQANDCFFLAMTRWRQGRKREAHQLFQQAIQWIQRNKEDAELRQFHVEAARLLGLPGPNTKAVAVAGQSEAGREQKPVKGAHKKGTQPDQAPVETNKRSETYGSQAPAPGDPSQEPLSTREDSISTLVQPSSDRRGKHRWIASRSVRSVLVARDGSR
jgi:serine/threonine protein kinase